MDNDWKENVNEISSSSSSLSLPSVDAAISSTMRQQSVAKWLVTHIINQRLGSAGKIDANNNLTPTLRFAQVSLDRRYNRA